MRDRGQDFALLQRFIRDGEQSAFADLVRRHLDLVFATALRKVEDVGTAQENYSLSGNTTMAGDIRDNFFTALTEAVGEERAELIKKTARAWMNELGLNERFTGLTIKRERVGDESRWKAELQDNARQRSDYLPMPDGDFPKALRILFPNGWSDLAQREEFELPKEPPRK